MQGPDLINLPSTAFALRLLPSSFAFAGDFLVADSSSVERVHISGEVATIAQTYTIPGQTAALFALNLDSNGTSFWVGDLSGHLYRIGIVSGLVEFGPITIPNTGPLSLLGGICVSGAATAAQPQPVIQTVSLSPANNTATVFNDNNSNSWTIT